MAQTFATNAATIDVYSEKLSTTNLHVLKLIFLLPGSSDEGRAMFTNSA